MTHMGDAAARAMADQLTAEVMDRAVRMVKTKIAEDGVSPLTPTELDAVELGVAAGFAVTMLALTERDWIRGPS